MFDRSSDSRIRAAVFEWLALQQSLHGDVLPHRLLQHGATVDGVRVPLLGPQGIFKPRVLAVPLSMTTVFGGPYDDAFGADGLLRYRYRGNDPDHRDNVGLRSAMAERLPLVYLHGIAVGKYLAAWPVFLVVDDPKRLTFTVAVDDATHAQVPPLRPNRVEEGAMIGRRQYVTTLVRQRLHQRSFRERVMEAYRTQCAFCRFRHAELLDAAHIVPDTDSDGEPIVVNGIALCRFHHAAFDHGFLGVRPDYRIEVRPDLLLETDGPSLEHGIQGLQGSTILLPSRPALRPSPERLASRYDRFLAGIKPSL
jgi:putative restriction endonuclease